jgi:enoyl-CoA hydratase
VTDQLLDYRLDGPLAVLTLDDGKANAYSHAALDAIGEGFDRAEKEAGGVLLVGRPGRFSAGFDLSVMTSGDEPMRALVTAGAELLLRVFTFPAPVVVACTGHALAAGALMLLSADRRIGADGPFKIGLNEVAIGMGLPHFAIELARYRMPASAFDSALLGQTFEPAAAVGAGYLDRVVAAEDLLAEATAEARQLAELSRGAVAHSKRLARQGIVDDIRARLAGDMAATTGPSAG